MKNIDTLVLVQLLSGSTTCYATYQLLSLNRDWPKIQGLRIVVDLRKSNTQVTDFALPNFA